jgi:hypothetical protein
MQKKYTILLILFLAATLVTATSLTKEEKDLIKDCKNNCRDVKKLEYNICKDTYGDCRNACKEDYNICTDNQKEIRDQCKVSCTDNKCISQCNKDYNNNKKQLCTYSECRKSCSTTYKDCRKTLANDYKECRNSCPYVALDDNIICEGGYKPKDTFAQGCDICQCNYNGKITCEKTDYCHFTEPEIEQTDCEEAGGFYYRLCKGPYFGVACSKDYFCICEGDNKYTCPQDNTCVKNFIPPKIKENTLPGWRDLLGNPLGDIGVCAPNIKIETCGDDVCDPKELETELTCPADCQ